MPRGLGYTEGLIARPQRHIEPRLGYIDTYKHWFSYRLLLQRRSPSLRDAGS